MINGLTNSVFHDDERFWPIYERAAALDVPIYIHPAIPQPAVVDAYYKDYAQKHPGLLRAGWGFNVETATQGIRLCCRACSTPIPVSRSSSAIWARASRSI